MHAKNSVIVQNTRIAFKKRLGAARSALCFVITYYRLKLFASGV